MSVEGVVREVLPERVAMRPCSARASCSWRPGLHSFTLPEQIMYLTSWLVKRALLWDLTTESVLNFSDVSRQTMHECKQGVFVCDTTVA